MPSFTYKPGPDEPEVIRYQGRTVTAGEPIEIDEKDPVLRKYQGHPQFEEQGAKTNSENANKQQAEANLKARDKLAEGRKSTSEARQKAQAELAKAEAEERRLSLSERAMGQLSPAEVRAMEQVRGTRGEDPGPVPGDEGYQAQSARGDGVSGGGRVERTGAAGAGALEPDNQAKSENRAQ